MLEILTELKGNSYRERHLTEATKPLSYPCFRTLDDASDIHLQRQMPNPLHNPINGLMLDTFSSLRLA